MRFKLTYKGPLKSGNSKDNKYIHRVRKYFHPQLRKLWEHPPLSEISDVQGSRRTDDGYVVGLLQDVCNFKFLPLVSSAYGWNAVAELKILLLRPYPAGKLLGAGGDLDNRMKVLFDALRMPNDQELNGIGPSDGEEPFCVLLEDDALVTGVAIETDTFLDTVPINDSGAEVKNYVELVIDVTIRVTRTSMKNLGIAG